MIIYENTKSGFLKDVDNKRIGDILWTLGASTNEKERESWDNSSVYTANVLRDSAFDDDISVYMEYEVRFTEKRVDFMIAGSDDQGNNHLIAIELKQWTDCERTGKDGYVKAATGGHMQTVPHPSYQAHDYIEMIRAFCKSITDENIGLHSCAYLHNFKSSALPELTCGLYSDMVKESPVFISGEEEKQKLIAYLSRFVKHKGTIQIVDSIESSELAPSKSLQDTLASMLNGNNEFTLFGEQRAIYQTVYQQVVDAVNNATNGTLQKACIIVKGGPGTGKSVVAIQLLVDLISKKQYSACYISKNGAPRNVYSKKLKDNHFKGNFVDSIFKSSGAFTSTGNNVFDCLLADEAHRLNEHSGLYGNQGVNQVKEIIHSAKVSVFFIDEHQKIATSDIGSVEEIKKWAAKENATVYDDFELVSQFRCNGSNGYLDFVDNLLGFNPSADYSTDFDYDIKIFSDPNQMRLAIELKNEINNKARMLAGYCYEWMTKTGLSTRRLAQIQGYRREKNVYSDIPSGINADDYDIILRKYGDSRKSFFAKWNLNTTSTFAIDPNSIDQVGCIHTSQGLEFDYCGVIIGKDLRFENGKVITDKTQNANTDGYSGIHDKSTTVELADELIRNTYKVLLTRGQKGCYIFCEDKALADHILGMLDLSYADATDDLTPSQKSGLDTLLLGRNCFVTGEGGTGKSFLIDRFTQTVRGVKKILKCAPTGIAAEHIGGVTIHKAFRIPALPSVKTRNDMAYGKVIENIAKYDIVIIDEISMCRIDMFEYVMRVIDEASKKREIPIQIVLCGDFFQLPPVVPEAEAVILEQYYGTKEGFAFESPEWGNHGFTFIDLKENVRQGSNADSGALEFMENLNNLRAHRNEAQTLEYFNGKTQSKKFDTEDVIELHATNAEVDKHNSEALERLPGETYTYSAVIEGEFPEEKYPAEPIISLKDGAKVIFLRNNGEEYQNGSIGIVKKCYSDMVIVAVNHRNIPVTPIKFEAYKDPISDDSGDTVIQEKYDGSFTQLPLRLAYAMTVHKSQGQTFDKVNFDPLGNGLDSLQNGQLYVALSRLTDIGGLHLYHDISPKDWKTSQKVLDFYSAGNSSSTSAESVNYRFNDVVIIKKTPMTFNNVIKNVRVSLKENSITPDAKTIFDYLTGALNVTRKKVYFGYFPNITFENVQVLYEEYISNLEL